MYLVLFDIDGTLVNTGGAGLVAFQQTFAHEFNIPQLPDDITFAGRSDRAIAEEIMQLSGVKPTAEAWQRFCDGYLDRLQTCLATSKGEVLPGVLPLIESLQKIPQVALGLLTGNVEAGARAKLGHYGIAHHFDFGGYGDLHTNRNDIAATALHTAQTHLASRNGTTPQQVMVLGDTPQDIACARSIGAYAVAVATGGSPEAELAAAAPDLLVADLTDRDPLLAEINNYLSADGISPTAD